MKVSGGMGWGAELGIVFISGFLLATFFWLGLWFFIARPVEAEAVRQRDTALREKETALVQCLGVRDECQEERSRIRTENARLEAKLKEALVGWGRCIRSKAIPESPGRDQRLGPRPLAASVEAIRE
jgi:hypothetical protein